MPILLIRDHAFRVTLSHAVPCKGTAGSEYPVRQAAYSIKQLGHSKIVFRSHNEPALLDVKTEVCQSLRKTHGMTVVEEESPVEDHQAHGVVESANREFGGMSRTLNDQLIHNHGWTPPTDHPIYTWLTNYCGFLLTRFQHGADGKCHMNALRKP